MTNMEQLAKETKEAARFLAKSSGADRVRVLHSIADRIEGAAADLKKANAIDLEGAHKKGLTKAMIDRLTLKDSVIEQMAEGTREVAAQQDPVGQIQNIYERPNGLKVGRMRIPLGVIGIIYESRPNVTADAAALCLKSANAVILRGGSEAFHSNKAIADVIGAALEENGFPRQTVTLVPSTDRELVRQMLSLEEYIDVIIPRGGEDLIRTVVAESKIPVIKHYKGVCHTFVDASADTAMAEELCFNAKVQKTGVCNAMETLLVHRDIAKAFLPGMIKRFLDAGVELRGCPETRAFDSRVKDATEADWFEEYLDMILAVKVVGDMEEAVDHIARYGSDHTETIVTNDHANAMRFLKEVQSSVVLINASTRFNDGFQLGLGAEIGISTTKLHAYGPMGAEELTTTKFVVFGEGQIRE